MAAGRVSPKVPTTTRDLDGGYSLIKPMAFALSYALAPVLSKHTPEVRCATDLHPTNSHRRNSANRGLRRRSGRGIDAAQYAGRDRRL
jgi:hypothetical protein